MGCEGQARQKRCVRNLYLCWRWWTNSQTFRMGVLGSYQEVLFCVQYVGNSGHPLETNRAITQARTLDWNSLTHQEGGGDLCYWRQVDEDKGDNPGSGRLVRGWEAITQEIGKGLGFLDMCIPLLQMDDPLPQGSVSHYIRIETGER